MSQLVFAPLYPGYTTLLTVTDLVPVAIVAQSCCSVISVREDSSVANWPTTNFNIMRPLSTSTAIQFPAGASYDFTAPNGTSWKPGQVAGYIQLPTVASTTFQQDEQGAGI